jgi:hypothetical protein
MHFISKKIFIMNDSGKLIIENKAPVLLIVFNRPESTEKVFSVIRNARPSKLYISADAPRPGNIEDEKKCSLVKKIIQKVDWNCKVFYRFSEVNQGCGPGPYNAISWALEGEDRVIILEDDCIPALSFFDYCSELLERYKNDTRIWIISGNQYNEEAVETPHSYFFSRYGHSQGWATWKRCWSTLDINMEKWPLIKQQDIFKAVFPSREETLFFKKIYDHAFSNISLNNHSWDIQFSFFLRSNNALSIVPKKNLVSNIGYLGTHSSRKLWFHDSEVDESYSIKSHPDFILPDVNYDKYHFKHHWKRKSSLFYRIKNKIFKILKSKISI